MVFPGVHSIIERQGMKWCLVYDFVFDRLRAVRQDLVMQGLGSVDSIKVLEPIVRFHSYAGYRYEWYLRFEVSTAVTMMIIIFWVLIRATRRHLPEDDNHHEWYSLPLESLIIFELTNGL
jgi:hypothetical protein